MCFLCKPRNNDSIVPIMFDLPRINKVDTHFFKRIMSSESFIWPYKYGLIMHIINFGVSSVDKKIIIIIAFIVGTN